MDTINIYLPGSLGDNIMQLPLALSAAGILGKDDFAPKLNLLMDISCCHHERGNPDSENKALKTLEWQAELLRLQPYVDSVKTAKGIDASEKSVCIDTNFQRTTEKIDMGRGDICWRNACQARQLRYWDTANQWLFLPENSQYDKYKNKIIVSATPRYYNKFVTWKCMEKLKNHVLFVGLESDRDGLYWRSHVHFDFLKVKDFVELAQVIKHSAFFCGTQSFPACLAEASKVPRIIIQAPQVPDVIPRGGIGNAVIDENDFKNTLEMYLEEFKTSLV